MFQRPIHCHTCSDTHFTDDLWAHNSNLVKYLWLLCQKIMLWSGHNFFHIVTAKTQMSCLVRYCELIGWLKSKFKQNQFWQDFNYELVNCSWHGSHASDDINISTQSVIWSQCACDSWMGCLRSLGLGLRADYVTSVCSVLCGRPEEQFHKGFMSS